MINLFKGKRTFHQHKFQQNSKLHELHKIAKMTLGGSHNMVQAVCAPRGQDENEWLAVNTVEFFNILNLWCGTLSELCTQDSCPSMTAGPKYEYLWQDPALRQPVKVSAPEYIDRLMTWLDSLLTNEAIFPFQPDLPFPADFRSNYLKNMYKRMFRVYAHIYYLHFSHVLALGMEAHLNTCFKHFIMFVLRHELVDKKELAPLADLIETFRSELDSSS